MKPGDVVKLKRGGPPMTVYELPDSVFCRCIWSDTSGVQSRVFWRCEVEPYRVIAG